MADGLEVKELESVVVRFSGDAGDLCYGDKI